MKLAMKTYASSLMITVTAAAVVAPRRSDQASFLGMNASCAGKASGKPKGHGYGKDKCPCIGIDNLRGYFAATLDFHHVQYPLEVGASCNTWERGIHPECKETPAPSWCRESWCYVDPCNCDLDVQPKRTNLGVTYQGNAAYFSYDTCNAFDFWTKAKNPDACILQKDSTSCSQKATCAWDGKQCRGKEAVQNCANNKAMSASSYGHGDCRCVGIGGHKNGKAVRHINDHEEASYSSNVGSSCQAWEQDVHPDCQKDGPKPAWCSQKWCFVDPCKCSLAQPPTAVMMANAYEKFQGKTAYFSYETCGSVNTWNDHLKEAYCTPYTSEASCQSVKKCMWTGGKCMGKALGEICAEQKSTGVLGIEYGTEDSAFGFRPFAGVLVAFGFLLVA